MVAAAVDDGGQAVSVADCDRNLVDLMTTVLYKITSRISSQFYEIRLDLSRGRCFLSIVILCIFLHFFIIIFCSPENRNSESVHI